MGMTSLDSLTIDVADLSAATAFYDTAFGLGDRLRFREQQPASSGFRGFTISLLVAQPANVGALFDAAVAIGGTSIKPVNRSLWGVGAVVQAPDGAIWKIATSAKKDAAPASRDVDSMVLLVAASDVGATKAFYADRGFEVGKSFGKYVEFATPGSPIGFGLYGRRALAKDAGVGPEGSGSHRLSIAGSAGAFVDPDGFEWTAAS
jgi:catechol 2,3-dioxygenase-like lactoylglutathione lyase family enzyme